MRSVPCSLDEFRSKCVVDPPADLVALARWKGGRTETITMTDRYDPAIGLLSEMEKRGVRFRRS